MKNILATLGSKKVMGAVLVMVTLVVGLGVISNFSGSDQKRDNDAALSNFGDNSYNNFYGNTASRADLERQLSLGQDSNTARFFRGNSEGMDEDDAFSADGAYGEGVRSDEGFVYGDAYGPNAGYDRGKQGAQGGAAGVGGAEGAYDPSNPMAIGGGVRGAYNPSDEPMYVQGTRLDDSVAPYGTSYGAGEQGTSGVQSARSSKKSADAKGAQGATGKLNPAGVSKGKKGKVGNGSGSGADAAAVAAEGGAAGAAGGAANAGAKGAKTAAEAAAEAAARAEKAKQARERANRMRRETQINKLAEATGSGSGSWGSMGGSANFGGAMGGYGDSGGRPLQSTDVGQANGGKVDAFRFGRAGSMGGFNVASGNGAESGGDRGKGLDALNSALYAQRASMRGSRSKASEGAKTQVDSAFDGSGGDDGGAMISGGASIQQAASQLGDPGINPSSPKSPNLGPAVTNLAEKRQRLEELQDEWSEKYWNMIMVSCIMSIASALLVMLAESVPGIWSIFLVAAAIILTLLNILYTWDALCGLGGHHENSLIYTIEQMNSPDLNPVNEDLPFYYKEWLAYTTGGLLNVAAITALLSGASVITGVGAIIATGIVGVGGIGSGIMHIINMIKKLTGSNSNIEEEVEEEEKKDENGGSGGGN